MGRALTARIAPVLTALGLLLAGAGAGAEEIGDPERGRDLFTAQCRTCHEVGEGARNRIGPHLNGLYGRRAGTLEGFRRYSPDIIRMGNDGLTWTLETLDPYLENPRLLVSGTRMSFRGMDNPADRSDVLAYLRIYSDNPQNIPEAEPTALPTNPDLVLPPEILAIEGDTAYGEYLSSECTTCHQASGGDDGIPSITNWPAEDFVLAMHAYKRKLRPHPVMQMMAGRLSDEEIAALAAYFETLE